MITLSFFIDIKDAKFFLPEIKDVKSKCFELIVNTDRFNGRIIIGPNSKVENNFKPTKLVQDAKYGPCTYK